MTEPPEGRAPKHRRLPVMLGRARMNPGERDVWTPRSAAARWPDWVSVGGLALAVAGAVLALQSAAVPVGLDAAGYRVGDSLLTPAGPGIYAGGGAIAIVHRGGGVHAAGSSSLGGAKVIGVCDMEDSGLVETCEFTIGKAKLTAVDHKAEQSWSRRYSDGRTATIALVSGRSVPVPFPVGR